MTRVIVTTHLLESIRADLDKLRREESWKHYPNRFLVAEVINRSIGRIDGVLESGRPREKEE